MLFFDLPEKWQQSCVQKEDWLKFPNNSVSPQLFRESHLESGLGLNAAAFDNFRTLTTEIFIELGDILLCQ